MIFFLSLSFFLAFFLSFFLSVFLSFFLSFFLSCCFVFCFCVVSTVFFQACSRREVMEKNLEIVLINRWQSMTTLQKHIRALSTNIVLVRKTLKKVLVTSLSYPLFFSQLLSSFWRCLSTLFSVYLAKTIPVESARIFCDLVIVRHLSVSTVSKFFSVVPPSPTVIYFYFEERYCRLKVSIDHSQWIFMKWGHKGHRDRKRCLGAWATVQTTESLTLSPFLHTPASLSISWLAVTLLIKNGPFWELWFVWKCMKS